MDATLPIGHRLPTRSSTARIAGGPTDTELVIPINSSRGPEGGFRDSIKMKKNLDHR
jgi:hypothetical protein